MAAAFVQVACGSDSESANSAARHVIEIRGLEFQPARLTIEPGDTVVWINRDMVPHTATASDGTWDSGAIAGGESWSFVPDREGTVPYACEYHPGMTGTLVVR